MGDAGASSMILLVTSLLVSGIAGAVIVEEWGKAIEVVQDAEHKNRYAQEFDVDFAGDMMSIQFDATTQELVFYLLNSGEHDLDDSVIQVLVNGSEADVGGGTGSISTSILPSGATDWQSGYLLEVTIADTAWSFDSGDDVSLSFTGISESYQGSKYSVNTFVEARLA